MASALTVSGPDLFRVRDGAVARPANSSHSRTTQAASGANYGGSTILTCGVVVDDPGDSDHAYGGVESAWAFLVRSPGAGPLELGIEFGALSFRAFGSRNNEWPWKSAHEVYAALIAFAEALHPVPQRLPTNNGILSQFWNVDLGPQNEAKMRQQVASGTEDVTLNRGSWERTLLPTPQMLRFRYAPPTPISEGDLVAFVVGFRLMVSAPLVDDYDFRLSTESSASIAWVNLESQA